MEHAEVWRALCRAVDDAQELCPHSVQLDDARVASFTREPESSEGRRFAFRNIQSKRIFRCQLHDGPKLSALVIALHVGNQVEIEHERLLGTHVLLPA
jgi:methyl coenzyme M reductase beta subunit